MTLEDDVKVTTHLGRDVIKVGGHLELNLIVEHPRPADPEELRAAVRRMEEEMRTRMAEEWARRGSEYLDRCAQEQKANEDYDRGGEMSGPGPEEDEG